MDSDSEPRADSDCDANGDGEDVSAAASSSTHAAPLSSKRCSCRCRCLCLGSAVATAYAAVDGAGPPHAAEAAAAADEARPGCAGVAVARTWYCGFLLVSASDLVSADALNPEGAARWNVGTAADGPVGGGQWPAAAAEVGDGTAALPQRRCAVDPTRPHHALRVKAQLQQQLQKAGQQRLRPNCATTMSSGRIAVMGARAGKAYCAGTPIAAAPAAACSTAVVRAPIRAPAVGAAAVAVDAAASEGVAATAGGYGIA